LPESSGRNANIAERLVAWRYDKRGIARICEIIGSMVGDRLPLGEFRVVRNVDAKPQRKSEARRIRKIGGPRRDEDDFLDSRALSQIDLYPLFAVGSRHHRAVIAVRRARLGRLTRLRQAGHLTGQLLERGIDRLNLGT